MVLNPRVEPWTRVSEAEPRGINHTFSSAVRVSPNPPTGGGGTIRQLAEKAD
jgi:hypothetical protein